MNWDQLRLNELPAHLDIVAFWVVVLGIGLIASFAIKALCDALARTDRISSGAMTAPAGELASAPVTKPAEPAPRAANANQGDPERRAA